MVFLDAMEEPDTSCEYRVIYCGSETGMLRLCVANIRVDGFVPYELPRARGRARLHQHSYSFPDST
jgi:hypothetical protein